MVTDAIDHAQLVAEIDAEVRRRRQAGDLPPDFERELDLVFARFAPANALGDDYEQVLERAEQTTLIDIAAPVESARPGVATLKRVVRKAIAFEVRHVAAQASNFAHTITRAVRLLGERLELLERTGTGAGNRTVLQAREAAGPIDVDHWAPVVAEAVAGAPGRVVHAEAGAGELVARLAAEGTDAYGVEPSEDLATAATDQGLEVRVDHAVDHLAAVPPGVLGAVVLSGCVDRLQLGSLVDLADLAVASLAPGGRVVVIGTDPVAWARDRSAIEVDLSPGRPLRAATWQHLLARRGLDRTVVHAGPASDGLRPVGVPEMDANLERLNAALFPPHSYAVVATGPA